MMDGWGWWMVFGGLWMVLFWGGIIFLIAWSVSRLTGGRSEGGQSEGARGGDALEIARQRYARGEISGEEYERIRDDLSR